MRRGRRRIIALAALVSLAALSSRAEDLVAYAVVGKEIPMSLTGGVGNPERGRQTIRDASTVTCLICHKIPIAGEPDQGEIGPNLAGVGSRYTEGELRLRLVDPKALNPDTIMPAYYRKDGLNRVLAFYKDRPIYTPMQIEDVVAFLSLLRDN
jgi:sulfur-oxidizing protein SoxX